MKRIVLVTGGFDPIHSGHIEYFNSAKSFGNELIVGLNSDEWLTRKKGKPFMPFKERKSIIESLKMVDKVIEFDDSDDTANLAIYKVGSTLGKGDKVIFANGGDRTNQSTPEYKLYNNYPWIEFEFGVGGENKKNSSSWILDEWKTARTHRTWGYWRVLDDKQPRVGQKVKELVINPGKSLSNQKHIFRSEFWYILEGDIMIELEFADHKESLYLTTHDTFTIPQEIWHKTSNIGKKPAHILEVQYGDKCEEEDIQRKK
jgi:cytidyltransferase-like protein